MKSKLENSIQLNEGEELISIIFINEEKKIHYSVIIKNTDPIRDVEDKLIKKYPELKKADLTYTFNGKKVLPKFSSKENNINNGDILNIGIEF